MKRFLFKEKMIIVWTAIILCYPFPPLYGQNPGLRFEDLSGKSGLPTGAINVITQDAQGFIWIGTGHGLAKYDGYSCITYLHTNGNPNSLCDNQIYALCADDDGSLWIGTRNGLSRYDAQSDRFENFVHDSSDDNSLAGNMIFALAKDTAGHLWIGAYNGGLDMMVRPLKKQGYRFIHHRHDDRDNTSISSNQVFSICFDKQNNAWIGTSDGLNILRQATKKFARFYNRPASKNSIGNDMVHNIFRKDDHIWISARGMLDKITRHESFARDGISVQHLLPGVIARQQLNDWVINDFMVDKSGNAWLATENQGLFKFTTSQQGDIISKRFVSDPQIPYGLTNSAVYCFFEDRYGVIWIGTETGISKYIPPKLRFNEVILPYRALTTGKPNIGAILSDKQNRLWLSNADTLYISSKESYQKIVLPRSAAGIDQVNVLYQSNAGDVYIGTLLEGLFIIPKSLHNIPGKKKWTRITHDKFPGLPSNNIYSIAEDTQGLIWIGTYKGLCKYNPADGLVHPVYTSPGGTIVPDYIIKTLCVDEKNITWCGTGNGLYLIKDGNVIKSFKRNERGSTSLSHSSITVCYIDRNKNIWIGTQEGLNLYNPLHDNFQRFEEKNSLSNDVINSLQEDPQGNLWIGTKHGLIKWNVHDKKADTYTMEDGLISDDFTGNASCSDSAGIFYFGTNNGLVSFKPENIVPTGYIPPVVITNIKILNKPLLSLGDTTLINTYRKENKLVLKYDQNFFSFEFTVLNYINPTTSQYAYMMEGVDRQWNYFGTQRLAGYADIAPGHYVFKVKVSNNAGVWSKIPATLDIIISPPWWQTWWFYTLCAVTACAIVYTIYRIRLRQILKVYTLRSNIAKDLHDDVGSALSSISLLSNMASEGRTNAGLKPDEIFSRIGDTSKQMIDLMDDIVWAVNPGNDRLSDILVRMREYAVEMLEAKNIAFTFKIQEDVDNMKIPMQMRKDYFLIFKEAVNNLSKYSGCLNASITIERIKHAIITIISDDGKGFDREIIHSGNGLKNMLQRSKAIKGKLHIETTCGKGTKVILTIPVT